MTPVNSSSQLLIRATGPALGVAFDNVLTTASSFSLSVPFFIRHVDITDAAGKPQFAAAIAPEGRVLGDVFDVAKKSGRFGVPRDVAAAVKPLPAEELEKLVGRETRVVVLGHLLRGGTPTSFDRLVALRFGAAAVRALESGHSSVMVSLEPPHVRYQPLEALVGRMKRVSLASDTIATARDLGISFGD